MPQNKSNSKKTGFFHELYSLKPLLKPYLGSYIAGLVFLIIADIGQLIIPQLIGQSVDIISEGRGDTALILRLAGFMALAAVAIAIARYAWRMFIIGSARRVEADLRNLLYDKYLSLTPAFFSRHKSGDLMARVTNDINSIRMSIAMGLVALVDGTLMTLFIIITLFSRYGYLSAFIILPFPLVTVMALVLGKFVGPLFLKTQQSFAKISDYVQESVSGIRVIKSFVREERTLEEFKNVNLEYRKANMRLARFWGGIFPAMNFVVGLSVLVLLYAGGIRVINGELTAGNFFMILAYLGMLAWPAKGAGWVVNLFQRGAAAMKRINEILNEAPDIKDAPDARTEIPLGDLKFESVRFRYSKEKTLLENLSFTVPKGETLGILGRTGSGKTTIVKLFSRLVDSDEGTISIGGEDIKTYARSSLRGCLSIVPQDIFLFSQSIRENIILSRPDASESEIQAAVSAAGLSKDISLFPNGLETVVGEKGIMLSGGQKQRIAIARALMTDSEILVLDDALSAVDAETEERILENIFKLRRGRTTLLISHRVSALSRCNRCLVLDEGCSVEEGTHSELMSNRNLYREIADLQRLENVEGRTL